MIVEVTQFNKQRNKLTIDMNLEGAMLLEEIKEFWDAETVAERLDALVDTEYVWYGTRIKASYNGISLPPETRVAIEESIHLMFTYLQEELGAHFHTCYSSAKKIVCEANALKGQKLNEDGKVLKDKAYKQAVDATVTIGLMIEATIKPREY